MQRLYRNKVLQFLTAIVLLTAACSLNAQLVNTGAISGSVTDPSGAAIPAATVTVTNQGTAVSRTLTTDSSGFYSVEGLSVGQYRVDVSKPGFQGNVTLDIQIDPGQRRANNVVLKVGTRNTTVTVAANAEQVNTESSESGGTISSEQIDNLMLSGRNFQTLAVAIPGVSSTYRADSLPAGSDASLLIVNGNSTEYQMYTIDGVYDVGSGSYAAINIQPIVDGIAEFSVLKDNYSAKYGFSGGGEVVVETKSGTRTFHGSAWDYFRNNVFDADNYYATSTPELHQNIFGYTLGGPLVIPKLYNTDRSKKTYFFASNQWALIAAGGVYRGAVFPQAMRNGDFSSSPTLNGDLTLDAHSQALLASEGKTNCITGPKTLNSACFDPVAVALLNAYIPLPNDVPGGFYNYINSGAEPTSRLDYQDRVDQSIGQNNLLTARMMYESINDPFPIDLEAGTPYNTITDDLYSTASNGLVRLQSTITPNLMNTAAAAMTDTRVHILTTKGGTMPGGASIAQKFPKAPTLGRIPTISLASGWSGLGIGWEPIVGSDGEGIMSDDVSWVRGNHVLQAGALYMFGIKRQNAFAVPQGSFSFTGVHTGDPAADYMLGLDTGYTQSSTQRHGAFHYRQGEAYVQDDWRASRRLTLNLGVRWAYFSNDTASGDQVSSFDPTLYNPAQAPVVNPNGSLQINSSNQPVTASGQPANLLNGLAFAGKNGVPSGFFIPTKTNFGPRVGFAYDVFGNGKTSIRGGYGIGYSRIPVAQIYNAFGANPPYDENATILNSLLSNGVAGGTAAAPTTQALSNVPFTFTPSQIQSYSLTAEQQIMPKMVSSLAYVGSQGRHLMAFEGGYDGNFPLPVTAPSVAGCLPAGQTPSASYDFDPCINGGISSPDYTRPYKGYTTMSNEYDEGSSNYNALQSSLIYRAGASQFSLAYTWSKALATVGEHAAGNNLSQLSVAQNSRNWHAEYGPPDYDFTNDIVATWVYSIPFFSHDSKPVALALGNWSFAGLGIHESGFATSPGLSTPTRGLAIRPNQIAPYRKLGKLDEWFDTSSYAAPNYGFFGNASNGSIRGPGYTAFDTSLYKTFPIKDRLSTQFRAEAFNVANHPNFGSPDTNVGDGAYGQITGAGKSRVLEFALKVMF